ncbi:bifunctional diguanylate cyclase/phosphodiesterase [Marinobacter persicus]|uniref:PAS domain S-box-containing protein/diguanylate cyclase (GGDEF)-like protein n=2 Tax=Marinobacter persicus TaxID=930118 RepID=A0A2S6G5R4_9GAMM|nr:EAL domain-containing protein [Marinobacter persicus]PPK50379.1 PAS domain S-box-containing protein/diguanylate cyclase (GGDEF)-like protein [Marinobacter persicus]PPK54461.1 PAS domain S-box-containing protein/diguanylate cyclase (GGDEF)-like protein [Marinobacter persicus]
MSKDVPCMQRWYAHFPGVIRVWLCIYVTVTSFQYLISGEHFSLLTFFFNGGLLLVALLDIARRLESTRLLVIFTILVFGSDWLLKTVLAGQPIIASLTMTSTLILQGWLGYLFLCFAGLNRDLPDTQKKVIWFSWAAALFPALISSFLVVLLSLYLNGPADWKTFGNDFLWWSVSRFTSIALVAPAILFLIEQYESDSGFSDEFFDGHFPLFAFGAVIAALVFFSVANPPGPELPSYSYFLLPVLLVASVRYPLYQSLFVLLLVGLASYTADAIASSSPDELRESGLALAVFLCISSAVVWHMGVLDRERSHSLAYLKQVAEVFQHSQESIIIADSKGTILNVNPAFTRITGYARGEAVGNNPRILNSGKQNRHFYEDLFKQLRAKGFWSGQFWNKRKNGEYYLQRGTISAVFADNGKPEHYISIMEDASIYNEAEERIQTLANYDPLTGLPNRVLLKERFSEAFVHARETRGVWSLLFIDLDDFKQVNDALGHYYGDELLKAVCERLKLHVRKADTLCRFGGDEFILLMQGGAKEAGQLARQLIDAIKPVFDIEGAQLHVGASVGVAVLFLDGDTLGELIQAADTAMYHAKNEGRGRVSFFAKSMQDKVQFRVALKPALQKAITEDELFLLYQPKVERSADGRFRAVGYEALVRWNNPETGMVSPGEFIPAAEDSGQIVEVDRWVMKAAVAQLAQWLKEPQTQVLPVAINVSAALFSRSEFVDDLRAIVESSGVPSSLIELEITEHAAIVDMENTLKTLRELRAMGFRLAIDDFGTGYSSLAYLREFPIDHLKIDLSFVRDVHIDPQKQGLVKAIIAMAHSLGLKTIAEGVEGREELELLLTNDCDAFQGYYFSKPIPASECGRIKLPSVTA